MHDLDRTQPGYTPEPYRSPRNGKGLSEDARMAMAAEMMNVQSEEEFEDFLGDLISQGAKAIGGFISSPTGQALGGALKGVAKQLLPVAGQALGGYLGGSTGAQIGGQLGSAASGLFESEAEEQEWEAANAFVQLATDAVKNAASAPPTADPKAVAKNAVIEAAKVHAPEIVPALTGGGLQSQGGPQGQPCHHHHGHSGHWTRRGDRIILHGV